MNTNLTVTIKDFTAEDAALILRPEKGAGFSLRLTRPAERVWRLQSAVTGSDFDGLGAAQILARDLGEPVPNGRLPFPVADEGGRLFAGAGGERLVIGLEPFYLAAKRGEDEILRITGARQQGEGFLLRGGLENGEALFGTGQRFNRANQRGKRIDIMAIDRWAATEGNSYVPVPFVLSSRSYALLLNRYEYSILDLGAEDADAWQFDQRKAPLDLYLFLDESPAAILKSYTELTGRAPPPAPWLFGIQVSRHLRLQEFSSGKGIGEMIEKMAENDFPWDAVIAEGWSAYDPGTYDDLRSITEKLHGLGKRILLYEPCGRIQDPNGRISREQVEKNLNLDRDYLIREPDGNVLLPENWKQSYNPADNPNPQLAQFIDITNPKALAWWYDAVWGPLVKDIGVDGCKIDFCEQLPDHIPLKFHDGRNSSGAHHWYPTLYNALMYRYFNKHRPEGGMCFSRGGGIGAQRYPFIWAGDQRREFGFLRAVLTSILSSGLSGIPFMSYDMAGYNPAQNGDPEEGVFIRGTEMGCFSSNMQTHGTVTRPYDFPDPVKDIYRVYAKLHQALRPYLVEQAGHACRAGTPLLRHLFLYDPADPNTPDIEDEYLLGEALLVAPVFSLAEARDIYLPGGSWRNILDGKTYPGGQTLKAFPAPFRQIPVFLLEGHGSRTIDAALAGAQGLLDKLRY